MSSLGNECRRLVGQAALVTGAAHGIGRAVALRLAAEGANVAITDVDQDAAEATVKSIKVCGPGRELGVGLRDRDRGGGEDSRQRS